MKCLGVVLQNTIATKQPPKTSPITIEEAFFIVIENKISLKVSRISICDVIFSLLFIVILDFFLML